jgi:hypothetical protein
LSSSAATNTSNNSTSSASSTSKKLVSSFLTGIRQRRWHPASNPNNGTSASTASANNSKTGILKSFNLNLSRNKSTTSNSTTTSQSNTTSKLQVAVAPSTNNSNMISNISANLLDNISSVSGDLEEFKDIENEEKVYGTELFDELPMNERRFKLEEQVS